MSAGDVTQATIEQIEQLGRAMIDRQIQTCEDGRHRAGRSRDRLAADHEATCANSYKRMRAVLDWRRDLSKLEWFELLGEQWDCCDNIYRYRQSLRRTLRAKSACLAAMMEPEERQGLDLLPERFTVYRGCYGFSTDGLSWSLSKSIAQSFPAKIRYYMPDWQAYLATGLVMRSQVVLKLGRKEFEIIAHTVDQVSLAPISSSLGAAA